MEPENANPLSRRLSWKDFETESKSFFETYLRVSLRDQMPLRLPSGEMHKFDLTSPDETIVIECKSHTWTKSGNYPSAKVTDSQRSVELLRKCKAKRKIIVFQDDLFGTKSLVEVFVRRNRLLLEGLEVWRLLDGSFQQFVDYSGLISESANRETNVLEIVFDERAKPYFEEQPKVVAGRVVTDRRYRVGIRNLGSVSLPKVRLVLENCEPDQCPGVHLGHTFHVMGDTNHLSEFSVPPGDVPTVFLDVVYDEISNGQAYGNAFGFCYSAPVLHYAIPRGSYLLSLRLDGEI